MTEGEVRPDEAESAQTGPPRAVCLPNLVLFGLESGSWFPETACSAIIAAVFVSHLGNVG